MVPSLILPGLGNTEGKRVLNSKHVSGKYNVLLVRWDQPFCLRRFKVHQHNMKVDIIFEVYLLFRVSFSRVMVCIIWHTMLQA